MRKVESMPSSISLSLPPSNPSRGNLTGYSMDVDDPMDIGDDSDRDIASLTRSSGTPSTGWPPISNFATRNALTNMPDGTPHLTGITFDPTGGWLYVGTQHGVFEWEVERAARGWDPGYASWA